jgi:hypothetical protein
MPRTGLRQRRAAGLRPGTASSRIVLKHALQATATNIEDER